MIYTTIPYEINQMYGEAIKANILKYNDDDIILILDHDVLLVQHRWNEICQKAVTILNKADPNWGWVTCVTNRIGCSVQKAEAYKTPAMFNGDVIRWSEDLNFHFLVAKEFFNFYKITNEKNEYSPVILKHTAEKIKFSGMFILTKAKLLKKFTNFPDNKFIGWDNWYYDRLKENKNTFYILPGLYIYHSYRRLWKNVK